MKFGIAIRRQLTGGELAVRIYQIASLLPCLYVLSASGYRGIFARYGVFSVLFDLGVSALPRWEALALSALYRLTSGELYFYFTMLALALVWGLVSRPALGERTGVTIRRIWAGLIAADLVFRLIPLRCNLVLGLPMAAAGFAVRLACLALILLDLRAHRRSDG